MCWARPVRARNSRASAVRSTERPIEDPMDIRTSKREDLPALEALYCDAVPGEKLMPLVRDLKAAGQATLSLVGLIQSAVVSHVVFTRCGVSGCNHDVALLGPLAVASAWQRRGLGSAIVREGLRRMEDGSVAWVCVLGAPAYYGRLGFVPEVHITPPYPLPSEWEGAWQSICLDSDEVRCRGKLSVPEPWLRPALWAP